MDISSTGTTIPLVSVRLMCYNHAAFIRQALDSILMQQTSFPIEVVVGDDYSSDTTPEILKEYAEKFPKIVKVLHRPIGGDYHTKRKKLGRLYNFTDIIAHCIGKYIALLDGDDHWTDPHKLQKQVTFMEANPDYIMCFTNGCVVDENDNLIKDKQLQLDFECDYTFDDMPIWAPTHTRLLRNFDVQELPKNFYRVGGADALLAAWQSKYGKVRYLNFNSSAYRLHDNGIFSTLADFDKTVFKINTNIEILKVLPDVLKVKNIIRKDFEYAGSTISHSIHKIKYTYLLIKLIKFYGLGGGIFLIRIFIRKVF